MDPQTQIKPKDVSLAHVSSNNQHLACFHCQDEAFEETMVGEEGGAVIIHGLMKFLGRMKDQRSGGYNIHNELNHERKKIQFHVCLDHCMITSKSKINVF